MRSIEHALSGPWQATADLPAPDESSFGSFDQLRLGAGQGWRGAHREQSLQLRVFAPSRASTSSAGTTERNPRGTYLLPPYSAKNRNHLPRPTSRLLPRLPSIPWSALCALPGAPGFKIFSCSLLWRRCVLRVVPGPGVRKSSPAGRSTRLSSTLSTDEASSPKSAPRLLRACIWPASSPGGYAFALPAVSHVEPLTLSHCSATPPARRSQSVLSRVPRRSGAASRRWGASCWTAGGKILPPRNVYIFLTAGFSALFTQNHAPTLHIVEGAFFLPAPPPAIWQVNTRTTRKPMDSGPWVFIRVPWLSPSRSLPLSALCRVLHPCYTLPHFRYKKLHSATLLLHSNSRQDLL